MNVSLSFSHRTSLPAFLPTLLLPAFPPAHLPCFPRSEIYELSVSDGSDVNGGPVLQGHCAESLWGVAMHPTKNEYATVGDDCTLRVWDVTTRRQLRSAPIGAPARTCAWSPDGSMICVGMGSWDARPDDPATQRGRRPKAEAARRGGGDGASGANAGSFKVFNSEDMALFHQAETMKVDAITQVCACVRV